MDKQALVPETDEFGNQLSNVLQSKAQNMEVHVSTTASSSSVEKTNAQLETKSNISEGDVKPDTTALDKEENAHVPALCSDMFSKMSLYLHGEMDSTLDDYSLLEKMNIATIEKYQSMHQMAKHVGDNLYSLNQKFVDLQPYLDQIEKIESSVLALEQSAYKLDMYSKRLEDRFKRMDKR